MLRQILNDCTSGSSVLLRNTLDYLESLVLSGKPLPDGVLNKLLKRHGGMACFIHLARFFSENELSLSSLAAFRRKVSMEEKKTLILFRDGFPEDVTRVMVFSHSGMVLKALRFLGRKLDVDVALCGPEAEGRDMAEALAGIPGMTPFLWGDGAYFSRVTEAEALVLGCDAVSANWFVNRSGSRALVMLAGAAGVPVYLVPGPLKFLSDEALLRLPLKRGALLPGLSACGVEWQNPMLERVSRNRVILVDGR